MEETEFLIFVHRCPHGSLLVVVSFQCVVVQASNASRVKVFVFSQCLLISGGCIQLSNYGLFPGDELYDPTKSAQLFTSLYRECQKLK